MLGHIKGKYPSIKHDVDEFIAYLALFLDLGIRFSKCCHQTYHSFGQNRCFLRASDASPLK